MPLVEERRTRVSNQKRREYSSMVSSCYNVPSHERTAEDSHTLQQISIDVPRTAPNVDFIRIPRIQV